MVTLPEQIVNGRNSICQNSVHIVSPHYFSTNKNTESKCSGELSDTNENPLRIAEVISHSVLLPERFGSSRLSPSVLIYELLQSYIHS